LRKDDEWVGCIVVWKEERWEKRRINLSQQKEAFNKDMYTLSHKVEIVEDMCRKKDVIAVTILMDSQSALRRIQSNETGPGQAVVLSTMRWESDIHLERFQWSINGYQHKIELKGMKKETGKQ
jgi:hypothetical protein